MKRKLISIVGVFVVLVCFATVTVLAYQMVYKEGSMKWYQSKITIATSKSMGENIQEVSCSHKACSIYDQNYQTVVDQKISKRLKESYTFDRPLLIYNAYGTNTTGIQMYFKTTTKVKVAYAIHVADDTIADYSNTLYAGSDKEYTTDHQYQLIGLVPNMKNEVTLTLINDKDEVIDTKVLSIMMKALDSKIDTTLALTDGESTDELVNGLYTVLGHDKNFNSNIYLYDNNGILRAELPLKSYRSDRVLWIDDHMVYAYQKNGIMFVNRLGKIEKQYHLGNYEMHHDFEYDKTHQKILVLASLKDTESIEDRVISLDLKTGEVNELLDMRDYFEEAYTSAKAVGGENAYGGTETDWIHLNSISIIDDRDILVSSRELSAVIRMNDIYTTPSLAYTLADESVFADTDIAAYNYTKVGDFVAQAGQHSAVYRSSDTLDDGQYYVYLYNNNYKTATTRPDFNWEHYPGTGTYNEGSESMYYEYLVDENAQTFTLVKEISLPYSSIVSSVQQIDSHYMTSSGKANCFNEFDDEGRLIRTFTYTAEKYAYRVFKYTYQHFWFQ